MTDLINLFPDPKFRTAQGMTVLGRNEFRNPSPTSASALWQATGGATVTAGLAGASIKGNGGARVSSGFTTGGVNIKHTTQPNGPSSLNFTVYVRALQAMTVTATSSANFITWEDQYTHKGWGNLGWGETYSYVPGASYTFLAGEVKRFRIYANVTIPQQGGNWNWVDPIEWTFKLAGTGTFDVDAAWVGTGVDDGVDPDGFPGGQDNIPNAELYYDGDTPDTDTFTYEWEGTPYNSASIRKGHLTKYLRTGGWDPDGTMPDNTYQMTLPTGESAAGIQSSWKVSADRTYFSQADGTFDLRPFGLVDGKKYLLSFDHVSLYENYFEGGLGGAWGDNIYFEVGDDNSRVQYGLPGVHPQRTRVHMPVLPASGGGDILSEITQYRNWITGASAITDVSLVEIDFAVDYKGDASTQEVDLTALGLTAGKSYNAKFDVLYNEGEYFRVEYQTGGTAWNQAYEYAYDPDYAGDYVAGQFDIPANATAVRMRGNQGWLYFTVFTTPPPYFHGDMPDAGGYAYSWAGTPWQSASIRSAAATIEGRVFVDGTAVSIAEIRVMVSGNLTSAVGVGAT